MKGNTKGKLIVLILAILFFGAYLLFRNPATDVYTYPPPHKIEQR